MFKKFSLKTVAIVSLVMSTTTVLKECTIEDEPLYNRKKGFLLAADHPKSPPARYCVEEGTNCRALFPAGYEFDPENGDPVHVYRAFLRAESEGTLDSFYDETAWDQLYPEMDEFHADILAKLKSGEYIARSGSDSSLFILNSPEATMTEENIIVALSVKKEQE